MQSLFLSAMVMERVVDFGHKRSFKLKPEEVRIATQVSQAQCRREFVDHDHDHWCTTVALVCIPVAVCECVVP